MKALLAEHPVNAELDAELDAALQAKIKADRRDQCRAGQRRYYAQHREEILARQCRWRKQFPEKYRAQKDRKNEAVLKKKRQAEAEDLEKNWERIFNEQVERQQRRKALKQERRIHNPREKEAQRAYYWNHREAILQKRKDYRQQFPEKVAAKNRASYWRCKERRIHALSLVHSPIDHPVSRRETARLGVPALQTRDDGVPRVPRREDERNLPLSHPWRRPADEKRHCESGVAP